MLERVEVIRLDGERFRRGEREREREEKSDWNTKMGTEQKLTGKFPQSSAKLVPLLQHALATAFDKGIEFDGECRHALAQVFEVEIHIRELG